MAIDMRMVTGILVGAILGLHYHDALIVYLPILTVATLIFLLKTIRQ